MMKHMNIAYISTLKLALSKKNKSNFLDVYDKL